MSVTLYLHDLPRWAIGPLAETLRDGAVKEVVVHRTPSPAVWALAHRRLGSAIRMTSLPSSRRRAAIWLAQARSLDVTEQLWRESVTAPRLGALLDRFFDDPHGHYALRKALILAVEWRLEAIFAAEGLAEETGAAVRFAPSSPLDLAILRITANPARGSRLLIEPWDRDPYRRVAERRARLAPLRNIARTLLRLAGVPVRRGWIVQSPRARPFFKVASDNKWAPGASVTLGRADDLFLVDGERIRTSDALILFNPRQPGAPRGAYTAVGATVVEPTRLPVPLDFWLRDALPRVARLLLATSTVRGPLATVFARETLEAATTAIGFEVLLQHVRIGVLTSVVEYDSSHIIKTLVLNRYGGRQIRLPHSHMDQPGVALAYLHYDVFGSAGDYLPAVWGGSWSPHTRAMAAGLLFGHAREGGADSASPGARDVVAAVRAQGRRIVTVLTSSNTDAAYAPHANADMDFEMLRLVLNVCAGLDDVTILLKPKLGHDTFLDTPRFQELLGPRLAAGRMHILHPRWSTECAAGYLLSRSDVNVAYGGSVVIEALQAGVPLLVPILGIAHMTPFVQKFMGTVFFEDPTEFQEMLSDMLQGKRAMSFDREAIRQWFDPFDDGRAIGRLRRITADLLDGRTPSLTDGGER